jgi:phenylpropionate dioxygenase-like ring-hydroxylating dioxygenase large terminal subunit
MNEHITRAQPKRLRAPALGLNHPKIPASHYTSQERFELERERIFRRAWLAIARIEEVAEPGDYILSDLPTLSAKIIVVRGDDGIVRGFHNSCLHRGLALVREPAGNTSIFRCPYHAWTYGRDGALKALPAACEFPTVELGRDGLPPVHTAVWNGFIFVNLAKQPAQTLDEFLGLVGERFAEAPFSDYPHALQFVHDLDTNWKHIANAFTEGYHLGFLHKKTLPFVFVPENPLTDYHGVEIMGIHSANTVERNPNWRPSAPVMQFVAAAAMLSGSDAPTAPSIVDHPSMNLDRIPYVMEEVINIFPNMQLQVLGNGYLWYTYWPIGPDKMRWEIRMYLAAKPTSYREEFIAEHLIVASRDVMTEDSSMSVLQHEGLSSGGLEDITLGENEYLLRHFAQSLDEWIQRE